MPLGWLWHDCARRPVQRAGIEWLVLVGIAASVTLVVVHGRLLIANGRDGASQLLGLSRAARHLVRDAPFFVGFQDHVSVPSDRQRDLDRHRSDRVARVWRS